MPLASTLERIARTADTSPCMFRVWSKTCPACHMTAPDWDEFTVMAAQDNDVHIFDVERAELAKLARMSNLFRTLDVRAFPTVIYSDPRVGGPVNVPAMIGSKRLVHELRSRRPRAIVRRRKRGMKGGMNQDPMAGILNNLQRLRVPRPPQQNPVRPVFTRRAHTGHVQPPAPRASVAASRRNPFGNNGSPSPIRTPKQSVESKPRRPSPRSKS